MSREKAGRLFREELGPTLGESQGYWERFANHVVTRATEFGRLDGYLAAGGDGTSPISHLRVVAVLDARTSEICRWMHGRVIPVAYAAALRDELMRASDPEDVKRVAPWPRPGDLRGKATSELLQENLGLAMPPYHFGCRTRTVAASEDEIRKEADYERFLKGVNPEVVREYVQEFSGAAPRRVLSAGNRRKGSPLDAREELVVYTYSDYLKGMGSINAELRTGNVSPYNRSFQRLLDGALERLPDFPPKAGGKGITYRSIDMDHEQARARWPVGEVVPEEAFTSTSRQWKVAEEWARGNKKGKVFFEIHGRKGKNIAPYSAYMDQEEALYGSGTPFRVLSVDQKQDALYIVVQESAMEKALGDKQKPKSTLEMTQEERLEHWEALHRKAEEEIARMTPEEYAEFHRMAVQIGQRMQDGY